MIRKEKNGIEWLEFEKLSSIPGLVHGSFLRHGGVSEGPYASLNAGGGSGDDPLKVTTNRDLIKEALRLHYLAESKQVHKDKLGCVSNEAVEPQECDGLLTQGKNIGLMIKHADCQAAIFYDPCHRAIANIHCGWRGNVQNIYAKTVREMGEKFGSHPKDLIVCIGPSLGPEVSEFVNYKQEFPEEFFPFQFKPFYFNLWEISKRQLIEAGIREDNIEIARLCTYAGAEDFFSYRRDKMTGRNATIVALI